MQVIGTLVDPQVPLMQAGLTSLGALKFGRSLQNQLSLDVPATLVFDHPSLLSVATLIAGTLTVPAAVVNEDEILHSLGDIVTGVVGTAVNPDTPLM